MALVHHCERVERLAQGPVLCSASDSPSRGHINASATTGVGLSGGSCRGRPRRSTCGAHPMVDPSNHPHWAGSSSSRRSMAYTIIIFGKPHEYSGPTTVTARFGARRGPVYAGAAGRLRISVSQASQLRPEPLPGSGEGLADYHGDAAAGDDDPGGDVQDALAEAAQAPPFPGRRLNHILTARNGHWNSYFFTG